VLQKRLQQQGVSFRQLLQTTRREIAQQLLQHGHISVTDLALNLGYAEVSIFSRHFKQWTGHSPRQWRQLNAPVKS
jgi:AraC-like DNA-binding protein